MGVVVVGVIGVCSVPHVAGGVVVTRRQNNLLLLLRL